MQTHDIITLKLTVVILSISTWILVESAHLSMTFILVNFDVLE